ncbi:MAG: D-alanyl-D-alanine carboxypeptidase [Erysipelotrichaceae bacterium]|nr:D-alanyl-D-alanine carboxypeptidase [Erysipelotrichaceae bacterium]
MFKKILVCICLCFLFSINHIHAENLAANAQSSILIEASTKQVLYKNNETEKLYPASTTKIMTMILMFEAINKGSLSWDEKLTCSEYAASMGGSQIYLEQGETMSVSDLFKSIAIASANDSCVMIAERIGGTIDSFVEMMNEKASELNLTNTHFVNATGLHDDNHYTCALDLSTMAAYLIDIGGDTLFETTSLYDSYIREDSDSKFWLVNTNKLLNSYEGCDGLKTGYTKEAGYCIVSTAKRNGLRLIAVVLKESNPTTRNTEVAQLLDYGFSLYESITLFKKDDVIENVDIKNATISSVDIVALNDITYIKNKNNASKITYECQYTNLNPPLNAGDVVGYLLLKQDNETIGSYELTIKQNIKALSLIEKAYDYLLNFI